MNEHMPVAIRIVADIRAGNAGPEQLAAFIDLVEKRAVKDALELQEPQPKPKPQTDAQFLCVLWHSAP